MCLWRRRSGRVCNIGIEGLTPPLACATALTHSFSRHHRHVLEAADGVATGQAQIWVDDQGTNSIVIVAGANAELSPQDVGAAEPLIAQAAVVVVRAAVW